MRRSLLCICIILLTASQLPAETYSWVDGDGVWNFSDDFYRVPKKYRKNVKRSGDDGSATTQPKEPVPEKGGAPDLKPVVNSDTDKQLYNGKKQSAWRAEFDLQEAELNRLELRLEELQGMLKKPDQFPRERQSELYKEYEALRVEYNGKYKIYSDLIESARKAGLIVEIKK